MQLNTEKLFLGNGKNNLLIIPSQGVYPGIELGYFCLPEVDGNIVCNSVFGGELGKGCIRFELLDPNSKSSIGEKVGGLAPIFHHNIETNSINVILGDIAEIGIILPFDFHLNYLLFRLKILKPIEIKISVGLRRSATGVEWADYAYLDSHGILFRGENNKWNAIFRIDSLSSFHLIENSRNLSLNPKPVLEYQMTPGKDLHIWKEKFLESSNIECYLSWQPELQLHTHSPKKYEIIVAENLIFWNYWAQKGEENITKFATNHLWKQFSVEMQNLYKKLYRNSLYVLKTLHHPSGALFAAGSTSFPDNAEGIGSWDYRYTWPRDASFGSEAFAIAGYLDEAASILNLFLNLAFVYPSNIPNKPDLQKPFRVIYSARGEIPQPEQVLKGYQFEFRIGNAASDMYQSDIEGEVIQALYTYFEQIKNSTNKSLFTGPFSRVYSFQTIEKILDFVQANWNMPDNGIWELRKPPVYRFNSLVNCWRALHVGAEIFSMYRDLLADLDVLVSQEKIDRFKKSAAEIKAFIFKKFTSKELGYLATDDPTEMGPDIGNSIAFFLEFLDPMSSSANTMLRKMEELLVVQSPFGVPTIKRFPTDKANYILGYYWFARSYLALNDKINALKYVEYASKLCDIHGFFAEQFDLEKGWLIGNFPQAYSHLGIIQLFHMIFQ